MKKFGLVIIFLLFSQVAFAAPNTGFYVGISGGYVIPQTMTISDPDNSANYMDATLKNGFLFGLKGGYNTPFTKGIMAFELEYNYITNDLDNGQILNVMGEGDGTLDGTISMHALMWNIKARYPEGRWHPYIGGGIG